MKEMLFGMKSNQVLTSTSNIAESAFKKFKYRGIDETNIMY